mgnify:CR=1 FL=1
MKKIKAEKHGNSKQRVRQVYGVTIKVLISNDCVIL